MPRPVSNTLSVPRRRWRVAILLALGVLVNFFGRINLSVSREALNVSFGISLMVFGYLSSPFSWQIAKDNGEIRNDIRSHRGRTLIVFRIYGAGGSAAGRGQPYFDTLTHDLFKQPLE